MSTPPVTVLVTVWRGIAPHHLVEALQGVKTQTRPADEVLVVEDGPLPSSLEAVLDRYDAPVLPVTRVRLPENRGSGPARQAGLVAASGEYVAIADADDVSLPGRLEHQLAAIERHGLDLVGAAVEEFDDASGRVLGVRRFPSEHDALVATIAWRNPFNHPSVVFRRDVALAAGGYRAVPLLEDYDLCARMVGAGARVGNCPEVLIRFRGGAAMLRRRRAWAAVRSEWTVQRSLHAAGALPAWQMPLAWVVRNAFRVLPGRVLAAAYRVAFLRRPR